MLLGPEGRWRDDLWLSHLVVDEAQAATARAVRPKLTTPLPINSCSVDSLTLLPGVGKVLAGRIDEIRRQGVRFTCAEDLKQGKGIGKALSSRLDTLLIYTARSDTAGA